MNPHTILAFITVTASIAVFQNRNLLDKFVMYPYIMVRENQWYRIITHAFIHADWAHLLFNIIALWSFGNYVYNVFVWITPIPEIHFYTMYFGAIVFSSIADITKQRDNQYYLSLGASGAVSAVIFCAILLDPWTPLYVFFIPCPGIVFGVIYLIYSNHMSKKGGDRINHDAHFYGAVFGLLYPLIIDSGIYSTFVAKLLHPNFW